MRRIAVVVVGLWTLGMAALFVFGLFGLGQSLKSTIIDGQISTLNGEPQTWEASLAHTLMFFGIYLGFGAGCVAFGVSLLRKLFRPPGTQVIPVRPLRGSIFLARRPDPYLLGFLLLLNAIGWGMVFNGVGHLLVGSRETHDLSVMMAVGGVFVLIGHAIVYQLTWVTIDIKARTWRSRRGAWPFRSVATGSLDEARQLAVTTEIREDDESGPCEMAVARLEWSEPDRTPLVLAEGPIAPYGNYGPAVLRWGCEVADLLGLPLVDKLKVAAFKVQELDV